LLNSDRLSSACVEELESYFSSGLVQMTTLEFRLPDSDFNNFAPNKLEQHSANSRIHRVKAIAQSDTNCYNFGLDCS
jgi:hypothetical protein